MERKKVAWCVCSIDWSYLPFDGEIRYVTAKLRDSDGNTLATELVATTRERHDKFLLDLFRPECRPNEVGQYAMFKSFNNAMQYIHDHCLIEITNWMTTRILT
jgi:hypothetical protein